LNHRLLSNWEWSNHLITVVFGYFHQRRPRFSCFRILHNEIFIRFIRFLKFSRNLHNILNFCLNLGKNIIHIYGLYKLPSKFL